MGADKNNGVNGEHTAQMIEAFNACIDQQTAVICRCFPNDTESQAAVLGMFLSGLSRGLEFAARPGITPEKAMQALQVSAASRGFSLVDSDHPAHPDHGTPPAPGSRPTDFHHPD